VTLYQRDHYLDRVISAFKINPVCAILGPRQVGKTTLAHQYAHLFAKEGEPVHFFDLERPLDVTRLDEPYTTLSELEGLVIIDEVQRRPELFPVLRVLVDERPRKFLILGSASRDLLQQSSETLAGRITYMELPPFQLFEVDTMLTLWRRGGFPKSFLSGTDEESLRWREDYITTFLEQDIPNLGIRIPAAHMRRFWMMLCHMHGQRLNASELGRSLDISDTTVRRYLDVLTGTFMMRSLTPWFENISKRQVKAPKIYFRDSGIFHAFLGLETQREIETHPKLGASWEGFALEQVINHYEARSEECYFWATQTSAELDLLLFKRGKRLGFEIKYTDTPKVTASMREAMETLKLDHLTIVYPGAQSYTQGEKISVVGLQSERFRAK